MYLPRHNEAREMIPVEENSADSLMDVVLTIQMDIEGWVQDIEEFLDEVDELRGDITDYFKKYSSKELDKKFNILSKLVS